MLINFTCSNFLSFKEEKTLSLLAATPVKEFQDENVFKADRYKLLKSAVIYGANASGKSNLLKAMIKMKNLLINSAKNSQKGEPLKIQPFQLSESTLKSPSKFEITFLVDNKKYRYGFEADNKEVKSEWLFFSTKIKEKPLFLRECEDIQVFNKFKNAGGVEKRTRENALFLSVCAQFNVEIAGDILEWFANFNIISGLQDKHFQRFSEDMFLNNHDAKKLITDFVKKADLGIKDINIKQLKVTDDIVPSSMPSEIKQSLLKEELSNISTLHNMYDHEGKISGKALFDFESQESEGSKKYFRLSGPIIDTLKKGKILVIDELDARLHPILTAEIVRLFNSKETNPNNAQLIIATHDTNLLGAKIFRRDQIWFTEKDYSEASDLYSLVEYKLAGRGKVRNDASFEKDYFQGRYGAIPFPGDFQSIWSK
ncbi:MAG: ATP-binding protein [Verrucomicrobiota bacterium]|nr:ATP-binding protein [Verrucomicrobiota bacterium]